MAPHSKVQVFVFIQTELHGKVHVETTKRMWLVMCQCLWHLSRLF
jgi:hypothetical protein